MSMALHEKIRHLREAESLTRSEFAEKTGLSPRTLEAIENKGNTPRGDVLESIAQCWPKYAYWLLTGESSAPAHIAPAQPDKNVIRFFERISNPRPELDEMMTKPEWFSRLVFMQCSDERNDLYAFIGTKQPARSGIKQCILLDGDMNFCSNHGGQNRLTDLAGLLEALGRSDLIKTAEMKLVTRSQLNALYENWEVQESALITPDLAKAEWLKKVHINFTAWRMGGTAYEPKYSYQDMV